MRPATLPGFLLATAFALASLTAQAPPPGAAQAPPPEPPPLGEAATQVMVRSYGEAEHWALRAIVLLSMGRDWHPAGVPIVLDALRSKDARLPPYGIELLLAMDDESLQQVATAELVDELIQRQLDRTNKHFHQRLLAALARMLPAAKATDRRGYEAWWLAAKPAYAAPAWTPPPAATGGGTVAGGAVERAFDLRDAGLDVAIVIDSTGSMQVAIDTARDAIDDIVALLSGIAPKLRLGLVHYKDYGDMKDGAELLVPMTRNQKEVRAQLADLTAEGGGDTPERVECGFETALRREMGWNKDANKLVLIVGDAPPHDDMVEPLIERVRGARERPFEGGKNPVTGAPKKTVRPFLTSTVATHPVTHEVFARVAAAGGGTAVLLEVPAGRPAAPPPAGKDKAAKAKDEANAAPGTAKGAQQLVEHVLLLSFGSQHRAQLQRFVRTYFAYRDAGMFR